MSLLDDHKFSPNRKVAYQHPSPAREDAEYGPEGPQRTSGTIHEVILVEDRWEYLVANTFNGEERRVPEEMIFHGLDSEYLDLRPRDGIYWSPSAPESAKADLSSGFWKASLSGFVRKGIPDILRREEDEERRRIDGCDLGLADGDYVRVRGDLRPEMESYHNSYARVLSVIEPNVSHLESAAGKHRVLHEYDVRLDSGDEARIYDIEIKTAYSTHGRSVILNWKAVMFLSEAFGDEQPYEVHLEYLESHIFSRTELAGLSSDELGQLLAKMLFAKGLITREELSGKTHDLSHSSPEYLTDHLIAISRFDMHSNRVMSSEEVAQARREEHRLRDLLA